MSYYVMVIEKVGARQERAIDIVCGSVSWEWTAADKILTRCT